MGRNAPFGRSAAHLWASRGIVANLLAAKNSFFYIINIIRPKIRSGSFRNPIPLGFPFQHRLSRVPFPHPPPFLGFSRVLPFFSRVRFGIASSFPAPPSCPFSPIFQGFPRSDPSLHPPLSRVRFVKPLLLGFPSWPPSSHPHCPATGGLGAIPHPFPTPPPPSGSPWAWSAEPHIRGQ